MDIPLDPSDPLTAAILAALPAAPIGSANRRAPIDVRGTRFVRATVLMRALRPMGYLFPHAETLMSDARRRGFETRVVRNRHGGVHSRWVGLGA